MQMYIEYFSSLLFHNQYTALHGINKSIDIIREGNTDFIGYEVWLIDAIGYAALCTYHCILCCCFVFHYPVTR